ncbi:Purine nucleoside phosphorylase 1 [Candidatus Hartigia pinicola]|nr:Purine nucleoside phosphorylase 1 [Candidatus Hartigia pinicola]
MHSINDILESLRFIKSYTDIKPTIGIILGSGLGSFAETLKNIVTVPYSKIPHFVKSQAIGHANELVIGTIAGKNIIVMKGRLHYYEGFSLDQVTFPIRLMNTLGVEKLIITNACGAVNTSFNQGDLMIITDHINLTGNNPLIGPNNPEWGVRFLDVSEVYNKKLCQVIQNVAKEQNVVLRQGVYAWCSGPTYETPAEIRMIRTLGADAVGMSTVPEALIAHHSGIKTVGISCLTNMACGILEQPLSHDEVMKTAEKVKVTFMKLLQGIIARF